MSPFRICARRPGLPSSDRKEVHTLRAELADARRRLAELEAAQAVIRCGEATWPVKAQDFLKLAELSSEGLFVFDLTARSNAAANESAAALLGYRPEEFARMGPHLIDTLFHPLDREDVKRGLDRFHRLPDGHTIEEDFLLAHKEGPWVAVRSRCTVLRRDAEGLATMIMGTWRPTEERVEPGKSVHPLEDFL